MATKRNKLLVSLFILSVLWLQQGYATTTYRCKTNGGGETETLAEALTACASKVGLRSFGNEHCNFNNMAVCTAAQLAIPNDTPQPGGVEGGEGVGTSYTEEVEITVTPLTDYVPVAGATNINCNSAKITAGLCTAISSAPAESSGLSN